MCEYNPVRAYIENHKCKDTKGNVVSSPITTANVNQVFEGTCVLQMAIQQDRMDVFEDAWAKGANPDKCEPKSFYSFLLLDCRANPALAQKYTDASVKAGWFKRTDQVRQLLEPGIIGSCAAAIEWALAKGAKATQKMGNPAYQGQTYLYFAYNHYARGFWYRNEDSKNTFRALLKSGGCAADLELPKVDPEAASVLDGIRREVCVG